MRKTISVLLIIAMFISVLFVMNVSADGETVTIDDITYESYDTYCAVKKCDENKSGDVIIPETVKFGGKNLPVERISYVAFDSCKYISNVEMPDRINYISFGAFQESGLTSITLPNSLKSITGNMFRKCFALESITIKANVKEIDEGAFDYCYNLKTVHYKGSKEMWDKIDITNERNEYLLNAEIIFEEPMTVTVDGITYTSNDSTSCEVTKCDENKSGKVTIPWSVHFDGKKLSVTSIVDKAFWECKNITGVTIPDSVTKIGENAFFDCTGLANVTIGNGVTKIGNAGFVYCESLTSVTIGDGLTTVNDYAFYGCSSLTNVYYTGSESDWNNISIGTFNDPLLSAKITYNCKGTSTKGDINGDGSVDNKDVVLLFRYVSGKSAYDPLYDYNEDGAVDNKDVVALFRFVSSAK